MPTVVRPGAPPRLIAFYLPQYHPIPENDAWWGPGFTEWTNVVRATPLFPGHYQPHLPADLGFYDLRLPEARQAQADLARAYGLYGFCYYHYWFNGRLVLERPLQEVLASGQPDFPFCLCWANENWTRAWDGLDQEVLLAQHYSVEDDRQHLRWLAHAFRDPRYIRVDGRPLFLVYRISKMPQPRLTADVWREEAYRLGLGDLYLCTVESLRDDRMDPAAVGFDAAVEFQPDWLNLGAPARMLPDNNRVFHYADLIERMLAKAPPYRYFPGVTPGWDNTARRRKDAFIFTGSTPDLYQRWLTRVIKRAPFAGEANFIFINAWNEWAEGAHLEPDQRWGRAYLEATRSALASAVPLAASAPQPPDFSRASGPRVSVCVPTYNGARYLRETLDSILGQTWQDFELLVVDDDSGDDTEAIAKSYTDPRIRFVRNPTRLGLAGNWNRCVELARGEYVCLFHQDDVMEPDNLAAKVAVLNQNATAGLVYSNVSQIGPNGERISDHWYFRPDPADVGVHTGQAFFRRLLLGVNEICCPSVVIRRACFERLGGFDPRLPFTADWEMWLRIALFYDIAYLAEPLIRYRRHSANETLKFSGPRELDHYFQAKMLALEKHPDRVNNLAALRAQVATMYVDQAIEQAQRCAQQQDLALARQYLSRAVQFHGQATPDQSAEAQLSWVLTFVDKLWQASGSSGPAPQPPELTPVNEQPLRYQPIFRQVLDNSSGRDIADFVPFRKILQAIAFKIAARPGFGWLYRFKGLGKKLLVR